MLQLFFCIPLMKSTFYILAQFCMSLRRLLCISRDPWENLPFYGILAACTRVSHFGHQSLTLDPRAAHWVLLSFPAVACQPSSLLLVLISGRSGFSEYGPLGLKLPCKWWGKRIFYWYLFQIRKFIFNQPKALFPEWSLTVSGEEEGERWVQTHRDNFSCNFKEVMIFWSPSLLSPDQEPPL